MGKRHTRREGFLSFSIVKVCIGKRPGFWDFQGAKSRPPSLLHAFELTDWGQKHLGMLVPKLPTNAAGCLITFLESKKLQNIEFTAAREGGILHHHTALWLQRASESQLLGCVLEQNWSQNCSRMESMPQKCFGYSYHSHIPFLRKSITCGLSNQLLPLLISTHSLPYQFLWAGACLQKAWIDLSRHLYAFLDVRVNYTSLLEVHQLK